MSDTSSIGKESSVCHLCASRLLNERAAKYHQKVWVQHPIEVRQRACRLCGIRKAWWWYVIHVEEVSLA